MSPTFVPFDTPDEDLPGIAMTERQRTPHSFPTQQTSASGGRRRNKQSQPRRPPGEDEHGPPVGSSRRMECAGPSQPSSRQDQGTPVITYKRKALATRPSPSCQKDEGGAFRKAVLREISEGSDEETEDDSRMVDEGDSGEDAEGVPPRDVSEHTQPSADTRDEAIDTTRCFFLWFDEDGFAKKKREHIEVDVTEILSIPEGDILFNHRTLVQSIYDAIHHAAKKTNGKWDFMTFILSPIVPNRDGSQGRRITPEQFDVELAHTYNWYVVAGQHTAEAMNRLIKDKSPAKKMYGLRSYSHVRVVYFYDDRKRGYPYVSTFDNTREECSIPRSFSSSVRQIRIFWDKRNGRIRPPGTVSPNDVEGMKRKKKWEEFMNAACKMTLDSGLMNSSLENDYCKDWTNKMRGYMNLAQCGETVWPLVEKFFNMYEKGLLPRVDGVRYIDLPGKVEGRLPGQYFLRDNSGKKILFHCIKARKGPSGATVSIPDLTPPIFKLFGDMTAKEKQVALHHMMRGDVIMTSRSVPRGRCNMADLVKYTRHERYMVHMFNYILFNVEGRSKEEWSVDFFIGYTTILERYNKNDLTDEKWTEERDRIPDDKARKVPRRLGGPDEINGENGAGLVATQGMYKETPFHLKCFIYEAIDCLDDLKAEVNRISSSACHIFWEVGKRITTILPFEIEPKGVLTDNEEVVGMTRGMKIRATILDISTSPKCVPWDDDAFSKLYAFLMTCCGENWALIIFASMKHQKQVMQSVYNWDDVEVLTGSWYRHYTPSTTLNKYGNIAVRYTDMMAIVLHVENDNLDNITAAPKFRAELTNLNVEEGEFVRCSGECIGVEGDTDAVYSWMERESARLRKLCSSLIREDDGVMLLGRAHARLIWELARAGHHVFEKPQVEHRKDRDIYYKLGRKREKVWAYLFGDALRSAVDNDYVMRKSELEIAMNEYHGSHMGVFHMFVARCEHLYFNMKKKALSCRDYTDLARKAGNFNNIDCDEDTSDSDLDVPSCATRRSAQGARAEEPQGSTNADAEKARSNLGATHASEGDVEHRMNARGEKNGVPTNPVGASEGIINSRGNTGGGENGCEMTPLTAGPSSTHAPQAEQRTLISMDIDEDEDMDMTVVMPKLVPGKPLPQGFDQDPSMPYLLQDKYKESSEEDWGHHILWHEVVFEPCVFAGKWQMAVKTKDHGWVTKERKDGAIGHSVTETKLFRWVAQENVSATEVAVAAKAKALFEHLRANKQLEFSTKFYDLASSVSYGSIDWKIKQASAVQGIDSVTSLKTQDVIASNTIVAMARGDAGCETDTRANAGHIQNEQLRACNQQSTQRSAKGDSTVIRKDGDDMESGTLTEPPTRGVNDEATIVESFGSLVATMAARQGVSEMMETDAG
ncbi:hypothetical protein CBR_g17859 [Chara braunii]|uniref:Uncharacterized protein n=1 Tax=Chara braunii TaxID=69332 RepID=A0A388KVQ8_CHABU|nr:hypothetical protein CBR_g17859 [Chara braunii]|eukprot:GBG74146.1 hypothetical protein CBR_g17859 [Chara braunii]